MDMKKLLLTLVAAITGSIAGYAVTFNVRVPSGTQKCYVCGAFNNWNADEALQMSPAGTDLFTLTLGDVANVSDGFKYLCGQSWDYVEKDAGGAEINNRTTLGNPDIVGSWYHVPDYSIDSNEIIVNGTKRLIKVYLPEGYDDSTDTYPVIYYNTVQQRYSNAGSDSDAGDDFFAANSWNAQSTMEMLRSSGGKAYVMVQVCSFLGENTPEVNYDFIGTGGASAWLDAFVDEVVPYVAGKYRVASDAANTTIVGADYGALFSVYASLMRPDLFGNCVAMSPMLWINDGAFAPLVSKATSSQRYYISAGGAEPQWLIDGARALSESLNATAADACYTEFAGATHTDDAWGASFGSILSAINSDEISVSGKSLVRNYAAADLEAEVYILYGGTDKNNMQTLGQLEYIGEYYGGTSMTPVPAQVVTNIIPANIKSTYYWNVAKETDGDHLWVLDTPKSVGFSSKKNADSWHNIAVFADGTTYNVAAHSNGFTVVNGSNKTAMTAAGNLLMQSTVAFPNTDKTFTIHYGSVNSASDMGAITKNYAVSDKCTEAIITYDFHTNTVTIKETETGESEPEIPFEERTYVLYGGETQGQLAKIGEMVYTENFRKIGSAVPTAAFVITNDIPVSVKGTYYYNIAKGTDPDAERVLANDGTIGFKSSKNEVSWQNVALFENGSVATVNAHSKAFRVVTSAGNTTMQQAGGHLSKATVAFPGSDKSFKINYGSVNSASDMGSMTPALSVSDDCIEAEITYDFNLNKVTVNETKLGASIDNISITSFTAVPAVCNAGSTVDIDLILNENCDVDITCRRNFSQQVGVTVESVSNTVRHITLDNVAEGIYTFTVSLSLGNNRLDNAAELNVRVLSPGELVEKDLSINVYDNIDWDNIGRYKANFHTHTSQSFDTQYSTTEVVDKYLAAGYKILALTDHDANSYPWNMFSLYNPAASDRDPEAMGMLAIPGIELSKDRRNNWSEKTGGEFNHHNDFFTGRKGQEFMSLRESYAYTQAIGGMQIINHPGQYWNLSNSYNPGEKNSPEWHAENFRLYDSLIGLEVYNQGNRRPDDRILWDQVLTINMPGTPVWGYSCDDTHTAEQYFRNYQFMLMPDLSVDALKEAMKAGRTVFSYEYTGSGEDKAPHINSINVDKENKTITIDSDDADNIEWIYSTHRTDSSSPLTTRSTVVGIGKSFPFKDYQGTYVRARLTNKYGETATQPFGFTVDNGTSHVSLPQVGEEKTDNMLKVMTDANTRTVTVECTEPMQRISVFNIAGMSVRYIECGMQTSVTFSSTDLADGVYVIVAATEKSAYTAKFHIAR